MIKHKGYAKNFAKFNLRYGRGNGHLSFIIGTIKLVVYYGGLSLLLEKWFGVRLPPWLGIVGAPLYIVIAYLVGLFDEKIGFWKQEAEYGIEELNPPLK